MSGDWQPGDLALCVKQGSVRCPDCNGSHNGLDAPPVGSVSEVARIIRCGAPEFCLPGMADDCNYPTLFLSTGRCGLATRFRKIHPLTPEEYEETMTELLTGQPIPAKV